jgi:PAS domain S-box-containing protein
VTSSKLITMAMVRRLLTEALIMVALTAVYFYVARISLAAAAAHHVVSSVWPPAGIAVFALVRFGLRFSPAIAVGAYLLNSTNGISPAGAVMIAVGNTLEAVVASYLLTRVAKMHRALDRVRDVLALVGFAGVLSTMIAASVGVLSLVLTGAALPDAAWHLWIVWWTGDAVGVLVVTPLLLTWTEPEREPLHAGTRGIEPAFSFVVLVAATEILFRARPGFEYLLFPMCTWIALRLGRRGVTTAAAAIMVIATWHTIEHTGPFVAFSSLGNLFALQLFVAVLAAKGMLFAAARSEARGSEMSLLESESRYRLLARNLPDAAVVLYDRNMRLLLVEGPAVATAGFVRDEVEGSTIAEVFDSEHATALVAPFYLAFAGRTIEFEFAFKDRMYMVRVLPLGEEASHPAYGMALAIDITDRHKAERELSESRARLQALSRQLLAAQENERKRVAREVHDELGQALTGIKLGLSALQNRGQRRPSIETDRRLKTVNDSIDGAIESVRRIVLRMRPGVLDNLGPLAALEWEVQAFTQQAGLPVRLALPQELSELDGEKSTTLYRTVQEALTNVVRHANATSVEVGLRVENGSLVLQVTDDGKGIAENELRNPRSMGILGMRERAMSCGGTLEVRRAVNGGTDVVLTVPYDSNGRYDT